MRALVRDAALALRMLARRPAFTAVALVTLALGIGAPTAIFSVVQAVLLRPLPYQEPDRLVRFRIEARGPGGPAAFDALPVSQALEWAANSTTLSAMAVFNDTSLTLSSPDGPFRLSGVAATPNLFEVLGVSPALGRTFDAAAPDAHQVVLSDTAWKQFFAAKAAVIGSSIQLNGMPYVVVGVMPSDFRYPTPEAAFWVPLLLTPGGQRGMLLPAIARLRPDATVVGVLDEGKRRLDDSGGDARFQQTLLAPTLQEQMVGGVRRELWVFMAAVGVVFVIATVNIALLLLTRGASRQREFSIRLALGAGRGRLLRQLFIEGLTLAVCGGAAGLVLAELALKALVSVAPPEMPRLQEAGLNGTVLTFTAVVTLATSLAFGILSAGRTVAIDPLRALGGGGGESSLAVGASPRRRLNILATGELALTMVLLVGAGLLLRAFVNLVLVDQGFKPHGAIALQVSLPSVRYPNPAARMAFHERLLDRLAHTPGIANAGLITAMPNRQASARFDYNPNGLREELDPFTMQIAEVRMASEGFFEAMGMPVLAGRTFRADDTAGAEPVIVISQRLARLHFPDQNPVGRLLYSHSGTRRVVGVVGDVLPAAPGPQSSPAAYVPMRQGVQVFEWLAGINVIVRGPRTDSLAASLRSVVLALDPEMPPFNVRTLDDEVSHLVAGPRFSAALLGAFAAVALVMAAVGVYGVMAYGVKQRTREIGLRVALGATRGQVLRLILRDGIRVVLGGTVVGLILAVWLARTMTGLLHEVTAADPLALVTVAALLSLTGLVAAYLPARRATRVSALSALREES